METNQCVRWRTAALGGHLDQCVRCGHQVISFNSCRSRHCPKCQGNARAKWLAARSAELLPVPYFHVMFTLPHELSALVRSARNSSLVRYLFWHHTLRHSLIIIRFQRIVVFSRCILSMQVAAKAVQPVW